MSFLDKLQEGLSGVGEAIKGAAGSAWNVIQPAEAQAGVNYPAYFRDLNMLRLNKDLPKLTDLGKDNMYSALMKIKDINPGALSPQEFKTFGGLRQGLEYTKNPEAVIPSVYAQHMKEALKVPDYFIDKGVNFSLFDSPEKAGGYAGLHTNKNREASLNPYVEPEKGVAYHEGIFHFGHNNPKELPFATLEQRKALSEIDSTLQIEGMNNLKTPTTKQIDFFGNRAKAQEPLTDFAASLEDWRSRPVEQFARKGQELLHDYFNSGGTKKGLTDSKLSEITQEAIDNANSKGMPFFRDKFGTAMKAIYDKRKAAGLIGGAALLTGAGVLGSAEEGQAQPVKINNLWRGSDSVSTIVTGDNVARAMYNLADRPVYRTIDNPMGANQFGDIFPVELNMANLFDVRQDPEKVFDIARIAQERFGRDPFTTIKEMSTGNWDAYESGEGNRRGVLGDIQSILKGEGYSGNWQVEPVKFQLADIPSLRPFVKRRYQDVFATFARPELSIGERWKKRNELVPLFEEMQNAVRPVEQGGQGLPIAEARKNVEHLIDPNVLYNGEPMQFFHPNWKPLLQEYRPDAYQLTDAYENKHMFPPDSQGYVSNRTISSNPTYTAPSTEDFYSPGTFTTIDPSNQSAFDKGAIDKLMESGHDVESAVEVLNQKHLGNEISLSSDITLKSFAKDFQFKAQAPSFDGENADQVLHYHIKSDLPAGSVNNDFSNKMAKATLEGELSADYKPTKKDFKKFLQWEKDKVNGVDADTMDIIHASTSELYKYFKTAIGDKAYTKILNESWGTPEATDTGQIIQSTASENISPITVPFPPSVKELNYAELAMTGNIKGIPASKTNNSNFAKYLKKHPDFDAAKVIDQYKEASDGELPSWYKENTPSAYPPEPPMEKIKEDTSDWIELDDELDTKKTAENVSDSKSPTDWQLFGLGAAATAGGIAYDESQGTKADAGLIGKFSGTPKLKDAELISQVENYLIGKGGFPGNPKELYRGIPKGAIPEAEDSSKYIHATPWAKVAETGGKGAFGSSSNDIYNYDVLPSTKYYRGGSLAGDPLETTTINSSKGISWEDAVSKTKEYYDKNISKGIDTLLSQGIKGKELEEYLPELEKEILSDAVLNLKKGTFETDAFAKSGIWENSTLPAGLNRTKPFLRSNDELQKIVDDKIAVGINPEDTPEYKILSASGNLKAMSNFDKTEEARSFFNPAGKMLGEAVPLKGIGDVAANGGYQAVNPVREGIPFGDAVKKAEEERKAFLGNSKIDVKGAFDVSNERDRLTQDAVDLVSHPIEYLKGYSGGMKKNLPELINYKDKNPIERMKDLSKTGINFSGELAGNLQERSIKLGGTGEKLVKNIIKGDASADDVMDVAKAIVGVASFAGGPLGHVANIANILSDKETSTLGNVALGISSAALAVPIIRKLNQSGVLLPLKNSGTTKDSLQKALEYFKTK